MPLRTPGSRNVRARSGGEPVVWELTGTVLGFVLTTGLVIVMARRSTAAWERQKRAAAVPRRPRADPASDPGGARARARAVLVRGAAAGLRLTRSVRAAVGTAGRVVPRPAERLRRPARAVRKVVEGLVPAWPGAAGPEPPPAIGVAHPWAVQDGDPAAAPEPPEDDGGERAPEVADHPEPVPQPVPEPEPESRPRRRRPLRLPHRHARPPVSR